MDDTDFAAPSHEEVRTDVRALFLGAIRMTLEMLLEEEIRGLVGAGRWQQVAGRKDQRNGSYLRGLLTSMGHLEVAVLEATFKKRGSSIHPSAEKRGIGGPRINARGAENWRQGSLEPRWAAEVDEMSDLEEGQAAGQMESPPLRDRQQQEAPVSRKRPPGGPGARASRARVLSLRGIVLALSKVRQGPSLLSRQVPHAGPQSAVAQCEPCLSGEPQPF
ncbi:transposase [Myxococcus sp. CA033]|nr:transposase [Myxococcus sp. CA033]